MKRNFYARIKSAIVTRAVKMVLSFVDREIENGTPRQQERLRKARRSLIHMKRLILGQKKGRADRSRRCPRRVLVADTQQMVQCVSEIPG